MYCEKPVTLTIDKGRSSATWCGRRGVLQVGTDRAATRESYRPLSGPQRPVRQAPRRPREPDVFQHPWYPGRTVPPTDPPPELDWDMWQGQAPSSPFASSVSVLRAFVAGWNIRAAV